MRIARFLGLLSKVLAMLLDVISTLGSTFTTLAASVGYASTSDRSILVTYGRLSRPQRAQPACGAFDSAIPGLARAPSLYFRYVCTSADTTTRILLAGPTFTPPTGLIWDTSVTNQKGLVQGPSPCYRHGLTSTPVAKTSSSAFALAVDLSQETRNQDESCRTCHRLQLHRLIHVHLSARLRVIGLQ